MKIKIALVVSLLAAITLVITACTAVPEDSQMEDINSVDSVNGDLETATFAGGCFWCMEPPFEMLDGVEDVISGYTGGDMENPSYEEVVSGMTGHYEAVQISYDPERITYEELLDVYWRQIDPTDEGGQFVDQGSQYRTAIFYHNQAQKEQAENSRLQLEESGKYDKPVVTQVLPYTEFYPAEDYHQDYYQKNPTRYKF